MQNFRKRRNDYDIFAEIIEFTKQPRKKTQIMYKANLNFKRLNEYIPKMLGLGLLMEVTGNPGLEFKNTEKGRDYLENYRKLRRCMEK